MVFYVVLICFILGVLVFRMEYIIFFWFMRVGFGWGNEVWCIRSFRVLYGGREEKRNYEEFFI